MPLDDLSLDLTPTAPPVPDLEVMTRVLRLPTASPRQARSIVKLQLDRLSPLPASEVAFDLAVLRRDGAETVYALGLLRQAALKQPAYAARRIIPARQTVEGQEVVFRFRNPGVVTDHETRWLSRAPQVALFALGLTSIVLVTSIRVQDWKERRLPQVTAEQRLNTRQAQTARQAQQAWSEWSGMGRTDAAARFLCVASHIAPDAVAVTAATADTAAVSLSPATDAASTRLQAAGGTLTSPPDQPALVTFGADICA